MDKIQQKQFCKKHKGYVCEAFSHDPNADSLLLCIQCILTQGVKQSSAVLLDNVLKCPKRGIIENWPPLGLNQDILSQKLNKLSKELGDTSSYLKSKISEFFDVFKEEILEQIQKVQKELLSQTDKYSNLQDPVLQVYLQIGEIEKLKTAVSKLIQNQGDSSLQELIKQKNQQSATNQKLIQEIMNKLDEEMTQFDFETPRKLVDNILNQIKEISFIKSKNEESNEDTSHIEIDMIRHAMLRRHEGILSFPEFLQLKLSGLDLLMSKLTTDLHSNESSPRSESSESMTIPQHQKIKLIKVEDDQQSNNILEMIIKGISGQQVDDDFIISLESDSLQFIRKIKSRGHSYAYIESPLNNSKKYILRCSFKNLTANCFSAVGLIPKKHIKRSWRRIDDSIFFAHNCFESDTVKKIIKGKNIWKSRKQNSEVEIQISIDQKIFTCLEYPNKENAIGLSLLDNQKLEIGESYYIGFYVFAIDDEIQINEFKIVDAF